MHEIYQLSHYYGNDLLQTQHSRIILIPDQKLERYLSMIVNDLDDLTVLRRWEQIVNEMDISSNKTDIYKNKLCCDDWRNNRLKTEHWKKTLFKTLLRLIHLEKRFTS